MVFACIKKPVNPKPLFLLYMWENILGLPHSNLCHFLNLSVWIPGETVGSLATTTITLPPEQSLCWDVTTHNDQWCNSDAITAGFLGSALFCRDHEVQVRKVFETHRTLHPYILLWGWPETPPMPRLRPGRCWCLAPPSEQSSPCCCLRYPRCSSCLTMAPELSFTSVYSNNILKYSTRHCWRSSWRSTDLYNGNWNCFSFSLISILSIVILSEALAIAFCFVGPVLLTLNTHASTHKVLACSFPSFSCLGVSPGYMLLVLDIHTLWSFDIRFSLEKCSNKLIFDYVSGFPLFHRVVTFSTHHSFHRFFKTK